MATPISNLSAATTLGDADLFLVQQGGVAKRLTWKNLKSQVTGKTISKFERVSSSGGYDMYRMSFSDGSHTDISVPNDHRSNRNLLDNPWFTVNQRGVSTWSSGYGPDRWYNLNGVNATYTASNQTLTTASNGYVAQKLTPQTAAYIDGKDVTISLMLLGSNNQVTYETASGHFGNEINTAHATLLFDKGFWRFQVHGSVKVKAAKLEVGRVSTLEYDIAPEYTAELLKCQGCFQLCSRGDIPRQDIRPYMIGDPVRTDKGNGVWEYSADL